MSNLYVTLGLKHTATQSQIRSAYRTLSKRYHPDMPEGSPETFNKIKHAHDVLTDPAMKAHYDRTGDILLTALEGVDEAEIMNILMQLMIAAMNQIEDCDVENVQSVTKRLFQEQIRAVKTNQQQHEAIKKKMEATKRRLKMKDPAGKDVLSALLASQIAESDRNLAKVARNLSLMERAGVILDQYDYSTNPMTASAGVRLNSSFYNFNVP